MNVFLLLANDSQRCGTDVVSMCNGGSVQRFFGYSGIIPRSEKMIHIYIGRKLNLGLGELKKRLRTFTTSYFLRFQTKKKPDGRIWDTP